MPGQDGAPRDTVLLAVLQRSEGATPPPAHITLPMCNGLSQPAEAPLPRSSKAYKEGFCNTVQSLNHTVTCTLHLVLMLLALLFLAEAASLCALLVGGPARLLRA